MPRHQSFDEIQKGTFFRVPCVTLRNEVEWVKTVEAGWNVLVGCDPDRIHQTALDLPALSLNPVALTPTSSPYGDGRAAEDCRSHGGIR